MRARDRCGPDLIIFHRSSSVVLDLLPEKVAGRALHAGLERWVGGRRSVQDLDLHTGGVCAGSVGDGEVVLALVALLDVVEDDLGVRLVGRHHDGLVIQILHRLVSLPPAHVRRRLAKDRQVEPEPVAGRDGDVSHRLGVDVGQNWGQTRQGL